jgi:hypothetical protein
MPAMSPTAASTSPAVRRLVLVPATASGKGDELVRRYRLARLRLAGREAAVSRRDAAKRGR